MDERPEEFLDDSDARGQLAALTNEFDSFTFAISHDLRASVRHIVGFSQLLRDECSQELDARGDDYLSRIQQAAERLGQELDGLLGLYRWSKKPLDRQWVDLSAIVNTAIARHRQADSLRNVISEIAPHCRIWGDAALLTRLIDSLIDNAWQCTSRSDVARIEFGVMPAVSGMQVCFVRDNGIGFHASQIRRLFTPFQRLHVEKGYQGLGMGLPIAQRVVHRHGGRIWAEGEPDKGATFYFALPSSAD